MKLKKLHLTMMAAAILFCNMASAQLFIDQATFTIQAGATVTVQGDVTSNVDIQGTGKVVLKGTANQNVNLGGFSIPNLEIDNMANATLTGNAKVSGDVLFTNGKLLLGNNNLALGSAATITSATNAKYVVTNGTGRLIKAALGATAFNFPIGNSLTAYSPVAVSNSGTADSIGARANVAVFSGGTTGPAFTKEVVNNTWTLTEAVAGGSNLSVTATWNAADELTNFDRTRAGLSRYITTPANNMGWDLLNTQATGAVGAGPYTFTRMGVTSVGTFAVGTRPVLSPLLVAPKIFLHGSYNTTTNVMNDALRTTNLIPLTEPYSSAPGGSLLSASNAVRGSGGGETSPNTVVGLAAGASTDNSIVDWVLVQLHNSGGTVISQRAALLQRDGDVVDVDGTSPVNLAGNAAGTDYFVSVKHRNHLGVRTAAVVALAKTTTTNYNFSDALAKAFLGTVTTNTAMIRVNLPAQPTPVFGLFSGNANSNGTTQKTGSATTNDYSIFLAAFSGTTSPVYLRTDFNLNGTVAKTGSATTNDYSKFLSNFTGIAVNIISQPNF